MHLKFLQVFCLLFLSNTSWYQETLYSGSLEADSYWTTFKGDWYIVKKDEQLVVVFEENFEAKKAPDLKIFLSKLPLEKIKGDNAANKEHAVLVSSLNTYKGRIETKIPEGIDLAEYQSLIVHCEKYAKLWGGSPLKK